MQEELAACPVVFAVKEIPLAFFRPGGAYMFFAHVIKGQPYNMPMLRRILELGCTLIDYEQRHRRQRPPIDLLRTACRAGRRAGDAVGAGAAPGRAGDRHAVHRGCAAPTSIAIWPKRRPRSRSVGQAIREGGLPPAVAPLSIGVAGYGNVARGAWEILDLLPIERDSARSSSPRSPPTPPRRAMWSMGPRSGRSTL